MTRHERMAHYCWEHKRSKVAYSFDIHWQKSRQYWRQWTKNRLNNEIDDMYTIPANNWLAVNEDQRLCLYHGSLVGGGEYKKIDWSIKQLRWSSAELWEISKSTGSGVLLSQFGANKFQFESKESGWQVKSGVPFCNMEVNRIKKRRCPAVSFSRSHKLSLIHNFRQIKVSGDIFLNHLQQPDFMTSWLFM